MTDLPGAQQHSENAGAPSAPGLVLAESVAPGILSPANSTPAPQTDVISAINQRIFDTSLDLILVVDRQGNLLRVSPSAQTILGYRPEEMVGRSARLFLYPADLDSTRNEMRLARRGRETRNFECRYTHKDGHVVPLSWMGVWSEPEEQHFFIGRDISEREASEERLRQAQKMEALGHLTGGMAHDFNNLLGIIIGSLDLLRLDDTLPAEQEELVSEALGAALRGADLTRRLLAFARRQPLQPVRIEPNELVGNIAGLLTRTLGEQIRIGIDLGSPLWPVSIDPAQLEASIINLATNARDAMPRGGRLTIRTTNRVLDEEYAAVHAEVTPGDFVMIEVSDTGEGIPPELLPRVFDPFFTTKETGKGSGLGLSMVFGFVKQSGGHINVYSEMGAGTTFRIYLPRDGTGESLSRHLAERSERGASGSEPILIVDDNEGIRRIVRRQLTDLGYFVLEADSGSAALAMLAEHQVALLFTDIVMPGGMDGAELARNALERWPGLKVVLTSGFPETRLADAGEPVTALRLLSKPYRRQDLARAIREALDS